LSGHQQHSSWNPLSSARNVPGKIDTRKTAPIDGSVPTDPRSPFQRVNPLGLLLTLTSLESTSLLEAANLTEETRSRRRRVRFKNDAPSSGTGSGAHQSNENISTNS